MKRKEKNVSESLSAGVAAGENTVLLNHSNSKKMRTTKKMARKMLVFAAFFMAVGVSKAQENTLKVADATETVSAGSEVKPVIVVPAKLAKAMDAAKRPSVKKRASTNVFQSTTYYYIGAGTDLASMKNTANWSTTPSSSYSCTGNLMVPCHVTITAPSTLSGFLSPFTTVNALVTAVGNKRSPNP